MFRQGDTVYVKYNLGLRRDPRYKYVRGRISSEHSVDPHYYNVIVPTISPNPLSIHTSRLFDKDPSRSVNTIEVPGIYTGYYKRKLKGKRSG